MDSSRVVFNSETNIKQILKIAIVGGGTMGRGIALAAARRGLGVLIIEKNEAEKDRSLTELSEYMDRKIARWSMTEAEKSTFLTQIRWATELDAITDERFIIEAIPEDYDLKKELLQELDSLQICNHSIFVTNTSTLSITELASVTHCPERVIGMHFLNPVEKARVVELVRGLKTSTETFNAAAALAEKLDRVAIEVYESPGYVTTRVILPMLNEAIHVLMAGVASAEDIDTAIKLGYDLPKGPLEMADEIGLDMVLNWLDTLFRDLGDEKYKPCPLLRMLVRAGNLGQKSGQGFFKYDSDGGRIIGSGQSAAAYQQFFKPGLVSERH